jgi:hypothetical protein
MRSSASEAIELHRNVRRLVAAFPRSIASATLAFAKMDAELFASSPKSLNFFRLLDEFSNLFQ